MKVILIRHGETDENVAHRHQPNATSLSIRGRQQAVAVGEKLAKCGVTHVLSSPLNRALQTASLIANQADLIPSINHDLAELERPRSMTGHKHFSLRSLFFYKFWFLGFAQGGESYRQLRQRILRVKTQLETLPPDAVVAVASHTVFINLFLAHLQRRWPLWPWQAAWVFLKLVRMPNGGTIELTYQANRWTRTSDLNLS